MQKLMQQAILEKYQGQVDDLVGLAPGSERVRLRALERAAELGMPTGRSEDWRYSDVRFLRDTAFSNADQSGHADLPGALTQKSAARFVFIDGDLSEELSDFAALAQVARVHPLADYLADHPLDGDSNGEDLDAGDDGVLHLNTALMRGGVVLSFPAGVVLDDPIELLHISTSKQAAASHLRHILELGEGARVSLFEHFVGHKDDTGAYWTNCVIQARVARGGVLRHYRLQEEGAKAYHTAKATVTLGADARYHAATLSLGAQVARFEGYVRIMGEGADATLDGVSLASSGQSHDVLTNIRHTIPGATSDQIFRTVADARGKTAFQGKVIVDPDAQQTAADQSFKALLFDRTGEANAKPELEILADDVKCSHGATVGELDEKAIFYLTSRGIDPVTARQILVAAFAADALERIENAEIKAAFATRIDRWMADRDIG